MVISLTDVVTQPVLLVLLPVTHKIEDVSVHALLIQHIGYTLIMENVFQLAPMVSGVIQLQKSVKPTVFRLIISSKITQPAQTFVLECVLLLTILVKQQHIIVFKYVLLQRLDRGSIQELRLCCKDVSLNVIHQDGGSLWTTENVWISVRKAIGASQ